MKLFKLALPCLFVSMITPASATTMLAQWSGYVVGGDVVGINGVGGSSIDGLAVGNYIGQAWTATVEYQSDPQPGQYFTQTDQGESLSSIGTLNTSPILSASITIDGQTIEISPLQGTVSAVVAFQNGDGGFGTSSGAGYIRAGVDYTRTLTISGDIPGGGWNDLATGFSGQFDQGPHLDLGTFEDCAADYISPQANGSTACLRMNLNATSITLVDPPSGVPEPAVWLMMFAGFMSVGASLRRRPVMAAN